MLSVLDIQAQAIENALLWKLSGNNLEQESYLYGTIHLACDVKISKPVKLAFETSEQLALEINMADPGLMATMMKHMYMTDGQTLSDFATKEELKTLQGFFDGKVPGMNFAMMQNIKPFFLSSMAMTSFLSCKQPQGYDTYFLNLAKQRDLRIFGLEKIEDQLRMVDNIPYKEQVNDLLEMANHSAEENSNMFSDMLKLYEAKNLQGLMNFMGEQESSLNLYTEEFLDNRNKNWIPVIEKNARDKSIFFAFGAAHLAGENGVVQLLRAAGYTVEPVN